MDIFRNGKRVALLTRDYEGDGIDGTDYVLKISVNEALRTRGDGVIEKELKNQLQISVQGSRSRTEQSEIIPRRESMFIFSIVA
jgi:hypothetical protein